MKRMYDVPDYTHPLAVDRQDLGDYDIGPDIELKLSGSKPQVFILNEYSVGIDEWLILNCDVPIYFIVNNQDSTADFGSLEITNFQGLYYAYIYPQVLKDLFPLLINVTPMVYLLQMSVRFKGVIYNA